MSDRNEDTGETSSAEAEGAVRECARLHAAYAAFRAATDKQERYIALLEAFEADVKDDAFAFIPVRAAMPVAVAKGGKIQWNVTETPHGKMLSVFTCREEVEKHPAPASVGVKLRAAFQMALASNDLAGILLNPLDGHRGVPVERRNLEVMARRLSGANGQMPKLNPGIVSASVYRLWEIAVGVPTAVYDVSAEVKALGGMEKILKPLLDKWQAKLQEDAGAYPEPMDYAKAVLGDVISCGFVYGAMALKDPGAALEADVERCIGAIPDLRGDIAQNLDEYLILVSDAIRADLKEPNETHVQLLVVGNMPLIAFGAFSFGLGWGMAKNAESEGVMALAELRDRQQEWIENFKREAMEKMQEAKGEKSDEERE